MSCTWLHRFPIKPNRWIYVPTQESLDYGNIVKSALEAKWKAPAFYYHLHRGGHLKLVQDAKNYLYFSKYDFEYYFAQVTRNRICRSLKNYFSYDQSAEIANRSTVNQQSRSVPYGFPQSMLLASIVLDHSRLGRFLHQLIQRGFFVGVYVDDVIIASDNQEDLLKVSNELETIASLSNLVFSVHKTRKALPEIRAFNIDIAHSSLSISYLRYAEFVKVIQSDTNNNLVKEAIIGYANKINPEQAEYLTLIGKLEH